MKLSWKSEAANNPGYSVWATVPPRDPNVLYVIRRKKATPDFKPGLWRVFARNTNSGALKTIFTDTSLPVCKKYVQEWEDKLDVSSD